MQDRPPASRRGGSVARLLLFNTTPRAHGPPWGSLSLWTGAWPTQPAMTQAVNRRGERGRGLPLSLQQPGSINRSAVRSSNCCGSAHAPQRRLSHEQQRNPPHMYRSRAPISRAAITAARRARARSPILVAVLRASRRRPSSSAIMSWRAVVPAMLIACRAAIQTSHSGASGARSVAGARHRRSGIGV